MNYEPQQLSSLVYDLKLHTPKKSQFQRYFYVNFVITVGLDTYEDLQFHFMAINNTQF